MSKKCTTVGELVSRVSRMLNDDVRTEDCTGASTTNNLADFDYVRWSKAELVDYLNEGLTMLQGLRPDEFTKSVVLTLSAGRKHDLPDEYANLVSVDSMASKDSDGELIIGDPILPEDQATSKIIRDKCADEECANGEDKPITNYSMMQTNPDEFYTTPPVARDSEVQVCATVVMQACKFTCEDLDECTGINRSNDAALVNWMLHRAYGGEIESEYASRASSRFEAAFYRIVQREYLQESRFNSGYYLGKTDIGDNDPQVSRNAS